MSKSRLHARLRQNDDYAALAKEIKRLGLKHRVELLPGKGQHPRVIVTDGERECAVRIASTPRSANIARELKKLRLALVEADMMPED